MSLWPAFVAVCILPALGRPVAAQTTGGESTPAQVTTRSGIFSREQAIRGQDIYAGSCRSCHTPQSHTGAQFRTKWSGRALWDLFAYIRDQMPKNEPGTLSARENADVLAYLLRLNNMPTGFKELPADSATLYLIRIETPIPVRKQP